MTKSRVRRASARKARPKKRASTRRPAAKTAKKKPTPIPPGYHTVTAALACRGAAGAIDFYKKAFDAREVMRMSGPGGSVAHAEIRIGDSRIMLGDEMPEMGASAPQTVGGSPVRLFLYVKNVDRTFEQAVAAGATVEMPPTDMFWGDRYAKVTDPFGHKWAMGTRIEVVTPREMARRGAEFMAGQS